MSDSLSRQEALDARLTRILKRSDFPSLAEHIQELMRRAGDEDTSVRQVTTVILKDLGLSLRVLRTANSAQYNRSGKPILTVAHAVALMGLEAMRDLAASLLLFQHFHKSVPGIKNLMMLSLLTANHARATAVEVGYPRCEEAYLIGMFRNLGEVLLACYFPADYAAVLHEMQTRKCAERPACLRVLGFSYEELGQLTSQRWNMPDRVVRCMQPEPAPLRPRNEEDLLRALTCFSHELTAVLHREEREGMKSRLNRVLSTHGAVLGLSREVVERISNTAIGETKATFDLLHLPLDDLRLRAHAGQAMEDASGAGAAANRAEDVEQDAPAAPAEALLRDGRLAAASSIGSAAFDLNETVRMVLETIRLYGPFDRVVFALVSADHQRIQGRLGVGERSADLLGAFSFPLVRQAGPLAAAFLGRRDLYVFDGLYADTPFARTVRRPCFGLYPVVVDNVLAGGLYFDRTSPEGSLPPAVSQELRQLRDTVALAIRVAREKRAGGGLC